MEVRTDLIVQDHSTTEIRSFVCENLQVHPSDERIAAVILEIADFMLEFSTLGHEEAADIPQFVHPRIPNEVRPHSGAQHALRWCKNRRLAKVLPIHDVAMKSCTFV